jgi:hypothetical protein
MRKLTGVIWVSVLLIAVTASGIYAQGRRGNRRDAVCVYQNNYFQGWEECYAPGQEIPDLFTRNSQISSIRVFGDAEVYIYDDKNFRGTASHFTADVNDLGQVRWGGFAGTWNDRIKSFRVATPNYRAPVPLSRQDRLEDRRDIGAIRGERLPDSVCLYEDTEFRGRVECFDSGYEVRDLGRSGDWSDRVSSIRVIGNGRAAAYVDVGFRGERLIIENDIPDLKKYRLGNRNWDNQISSLEVAGGGGGRARGRR